MNPYLISVATFKAVDSSCLFLVGEMFIKPDLIYLDVLLTVKSTRLQETRELFN